MFLFKHTDVISRIWLNRILVGTIVVLALLAGYFYTRIQELQQQCQVASELYTLRKAV